MNKFNFSKRAIIKERKVIFLTILIIEDEKAIRENIQELLNKNGYQTLATQNGEDTLQVVEKENLQLVLLDIHLPLEDGFSLCKKIKKIKNIPVIFLTSDSRSKSELKSIQVGGIDYITKPFSKGILLEKIKRATKKNPLDYKEITKEEYTLDLHLSILKYKKKEIELTRNEFRILYYFFTNEKRIITKEELLEYLWNDKYYLDENILTVNIGRLRKKAKEIGIEELIKTERKKGYTL